MSEIEVEIRSIVHRRIWVGKGQCQMGVRSVVKNACRNLKQKPMRARKFYQICCDIMEGIGMRVDSITRRNWSDGSMTDADPDDFKGKIAERVYSFDEGAYVVRRTEEP